MTERKHRARPERTVLVAWLVLLGVLGVAVRGAKAQSDDGAGVVVSGKASSADVGLPIYPGAKPYRESAKDSEAARLGIWGGGMGFKLAVMKMESSDTPTKVADFYRKALAKYGRVLDCTNRGTNHDDSPGALTCEDDKPDKAGGMFFKAGTKEKQHIVAVEPSGNGSTFALVYLWAKGD
jgi:hypothetical protein